MAQIGVGVDLKEEVQILQNLSSNVGECGSTIVLVTATLLLFCIIFCYIVLRATIKANREILLTAIKEQKRKK